MLPLARASLLPDTWRGLCISTPDVPCTWPRSNSSSATAHAICASSSQGLHQLTALAVWARSTRGLPQWWSAGFVDQQHSGIAAALECWLYGRARLGLRLGLVWRHFSVVHASDHHSMPKAERSLSVTDLCGRKRHGTHLHLMFLGVRVQKMCRALQATRAQAWRLSNEWCLRRDAVAGICCNMLDLSAV